MQEHYQKPKVGFVLGDHAGIGPEIVLKLLKRPYLYDRCSPIIIGNYELLSRLAAHLCPELLLRSYQPEDAVRASQDAIGIPVINIDGDVDHVIMGMVNTAAGWIAYHSIVEAYRLLEQGIIEGVVLAPVTKESISRCGCGYRSEYEILGACAGVEELQTVVKGGGLLRSSVVGHIAFRDILKSLSTDRIIETGRKLAEMIRMVSDTTPHILTAALNPVEGTELGDEEREIILPAIRRLRAEGIDIDGPVPADTIFNRAIEHHYNGILYMYHDQGNIAMKVQMFQSTACIYTNVPYPILSTGHGSALDIADLGVANPTNISYVLTVLTDMIHKKRAARELQEKPSA